MRPTSVRGLDYLRRIVTLVGMPGVVIGLLALVSCGFGIFIFSRESRRLPNIGPEALRQAVTDYRSRISPGYLGHLPIALEDVSRYWYENRRSGNAAGVQRNQDQLQDMLGWLAKQWNQDGEIFWVIDRLRIVATDSPSAGATVSREDLATWSSSTASPSPSPSSLSLPLPLDRPEGEKLGPVHWLEPIALLHEGNLEREDWQRLGGVSPLELHVGYRLRSEFQSALGAMESSNRQIFLALLCLSGFPMLCLIFLTIQAGKMLQRVAREAARQATLDLADRTCHELGNVVFTLSNERRNLNDHLERVERFLGERQAAHESAALRSGLVADQLRKYENALSREYRRREIDPDFELKSSTTLARDVCRQIEVCSEFITMTVRELDGCLKLSALPAEPAPLSLEGCVQDVLALLGPRLESAGVTVRKSWPDPPPYVMADRRLLVHALVNVIKNALEALLTSSVRTSAPDGTFSPGPEIGLTVAGESRDHHHHHHHRRNCVVLLIWDNGPGIRPELAARIFESGVSTKGPGRGHGLAIVRESVQAQGGTLELLAPVPGQGACFRITLTQAQPPPQSQLPSPSLADAASTIGSGEFPGR